MPPVRFQEAAVVLANRCYRGDYRLLQLRAPQISAATQAGQFVHLQVPGQPQYLLRRPFSIGDVDPAAGTLTILFKAVGVGTAAMAALAAGLTVDLLGPLGHGFPDVPPDHELCVVAGGYGCAATYLAARRAPRPGVVLLGGRTAHDVLWREEFAATGCEVQVATNDGSLGHRGFVTELLPAVLARPDRRWLVCACGPNAMLRAVADLCLPRGVDPAVSVDLPMCCGIGACFTCVIRLKADNPDGWEYIRTCKDGPVFRASQIVWDGLA